MSNIINTRSPYFINQQADTGKILSEATIELYIYNGELGVDKPAGSTYSITKSSIGSTANNYITFEVSELIRDYLYTDYYNEAIHAVWVEADISYTHTDSTTGTNNIDYLAFDGFGYFEEGINPRTSTYADNTSYTPMVLQDNTTVYFVRGRDIRIPIFSESWAEVITTVGYGVWNEETDYWQESLPEWQSTTSPLYVDDTDFSDRKIQYIIISSDNALDGDTITITSRNQTSDPNYVEQEVVITLKEICEPKFDEYRCIFYNKYGALQDFWASKKSIITTKTKSTQFNRSIIDFSSGAAQYSVYKNANQRFDIVANQSITVNTPFIVEDINEPIEQMIMSENTWLEDSSNTSIDTLPVTIRTESLTRKTRVNDKLIQYTLEFDYAFDKINNIR